MEALVIAYGEGRNGKSTFWNVIARVLGTYSGNISADMLRAPTLVLFPALAIVLTAFSVNLLGDGLRDAMDPRLKS